MTTLKESDLTERQLFILLRGCGMMFHKVPLGEWDRQAIGMNDNFDLGDAGRHEGEELARLGWVEQNKRWPNVFWITREAMEALGVKLDWYGEDHKSWAKN